MSPYERPTDKFWSNAPIFIYSFIGIALASVIASAIEAAWK